MHIVFGLIRQVSTSILQHFSLIEQFSVLEGHQSKSNEIKHVAHSNPLLKKDKEWSKVDKERKKQNEKKNETKTKLDTTSPNRKHTNGQ
jgi:hypothetical protein